MPRRTIRHKRSDDRVQEVLDGLARVLLDIWLDERRMEIQDDPDSRARSPNEE